MKALAATVLRAATACTWYAVDLLRGTRPRPGHLRRLGEHPPRRAWWRKRARFVCDVCPCPDCKRMRRRP